MSEDEPRHIIPRPEDILSPEEAHLIQRAEREELPCPCCGETLAAAKVVGECYEGVVLYCLDNSCGYTEF